MNGKVLLTNDAKSEIDRILALSSSFRRRFYIYGRGFKDIEVFKKELSGDFTFIGLEALLEPWNIHVVVNNSDEDFFVLKCLRFSDIMDRNVETLQNVRGYKLVVDDHPFLGKSEIYWGYFLWSFFDRSLLGFPHCYAFRTFLRNNPVNYQELALKVLPKTETTFSKIFDDDIVTKKYVLDENSCIEYQNLKKELFESRTSIIEIIKCLRRFVLEKIPDLRRGFDLITFSRIFEQYKKGIRILALTDQKVDEYLSIKFWDYVQGVNLFVSTLWDNQK